MRTLIKFFDWLFRDDKPDETEMSSWVRYAKTREYEEKLKQQKT